MAIADRLTKLTTDITSAYTSIENKGGTTPANKNTNNLSTAIDSIEVIEQATAEGESLSLTNTKAMPYKNYVVKGKSEQTTRSGKNLANDNDMLQGYWAYADGGFVYTNTWICTPKIACKGNVDYTFQFANNSRWYGFVWYDENNNFISTTNQQNNLQTGFRSFTAKSPSNAGYLVINIAGYPGANDTISTDDLINFQLEEGSTATDYEPYGASPSPEYPSEIHSVADDVNLFDITDTSEINSNTSINILDNVITLTTNTTTGAQYAKNIISGLDSTKNYKLSFKAKKIVKGTDGQSYIRIVVYGSNDNSTYTALQYIGETNPTQGQEYFFTSNTFTGYSYYRFYIYNNANTPVTSGETTQYWDIKFQEGTIATPYSPYNQGTVTTKQRGKNEFDYKQIISSASMSIENGGFVINNTDFQNGYSIGKLKNLCPELKVGDKFKFNWDTNATRNNSDVNYIYLNLYANTIRKDITYTCTQEMLDSETYFYGQQGEYYKDIIFYLDGQTSDYEPYQANDYTIQTEPLRSLPNGVKDSKDTKQHTRVGRIVLDGTQPLEIVNWRPTETSVGWVYPRSITNNKKQTEGVINNILCNKLKAVSYTSLFGNTVDEGINIVTQSNAYGLVIKTKDTSLTTANAINTYLSSNPITVQYELATEVIEPFTQQQATTMLDIIETGSYEGTTNIYTDEDVKPTIGVGYYKKS